jgi:aspartate/glutamate racemase
VSAVADGEPVLGIIGGAGSAVLIATDATRAAGVHEGYGIEIVAPPAELRAEILALIAAAVEGPPPDAALLERLVERARRPPAPVVLGGTDICGLVAPSRAAALGVVESLGCLSERCADALARAGAAAVPAR